MINQYFNQYYLILIFCVLFYGCTNDETPNEQTTSTTDDTTSNDISTEDIIENLTDDAITSEDTHDTADIPTTPQTCSAAERPVQSAIIRRLDFIHETPSGICDGMNLDGLISTSADIDGCRKSDFISTSGEPGIDNQFAVLLPALEAVGGEEGLYSAIQRVINEGGVLLMIELEGLDDIENDACVAAQFSRATGRPTIGADGVLEPSQTLDRDPNFTPSRVPDSAVVNGELILGPVALTLPMYVSGYDLLITFHDTMLRFSIADDGTLSGLLAGSLDLQELFDVLDTIEDGTDILATLRRVLSTNADLAPNEEGKCQRMSIALRFEATPAFYFE